MNLLPIVFLVASVAALIYGYIQNNRNIMLAAALTLFLSVVFANSFAMFATPRRSLEGWLSRWVGGGAPPKSEASGVDRK